VTNVLAWMSLARFAVFFAFLSGENLPAKSLYINFCCDFYLFERGF
jgi:hypothetical protein